MCMYTLDNLAAFAALADLALFPTFIKLRVTFIKSDMQTRVKSNLCG